MVYCSITARYVVNHFSSIEAQWQIDSVKYSGNAFWVFVIFFYYIWRVVWSIKFDNRRYLCDNNNIVRKEDRFYEIVFFCCQTVLGILFISLDQIGNQISCIIPNYVIFHPRLPFIIENVSFFYEKLYPQKWTANH